MDWRKQQHVCRALQTKRHSDEKGYPEEMAPIVTLTELFAPTSSRSIRQFIHGDR
jgi:hypothetical protein